jgi:hypothetical protein
MLREANSFLASIAMNYDQTKRENENIPSEEVGF